MELKDLTYRKPSDLLDLAKMLFETGDFDGARFIEEDIRDYHRELYFLEKENKRLDLYSDSVVYGMTQIYNTIKDLRESIESAPRINRKELLASLKSIEQDFGEYI